MQSFNIVVYIITFIKNPENAPNLLALDHHLPLYWKKKFDDTDIIVVSRPILYWRFTENQGLLVLVQPVCVFQTYELLLQQYFWLAVKYILLNYLRTISYIHMADKSQAFLSVYVSNSNTTDNIISKLKIIKKIIFTFGTTTTLTLSCHTGVFRGKASNFWKFSCSMLENRVCVAILFWNDIYKISDVFLFNKVSFVYN